MKWLETIPFPLLIAATLLLGLAPYTPEPHIVEKIRMLSERTLRKPLDIADLLFHLLPVVLLVLKLSHRAVKMK